MLYGYIRVSTQISDTRANNQTFDRQLKILHDNGVVNDKNIFKERISGGVKTSTRPQWDKLISLVKPGDIIIVTEMSRLARSLQDLIETVNFLISKEVGIRFIKENISISSSGIDSMNRLIFNLFGAFAEFEKDLIRERTKQGLQAKKEMGVKLGRSNKLNEEQIIEFKKAYLRGDKIEQLKEQFNLSKQGIYNYINILELKHRNSKRL